MTLFDLKENRIIKTDRAALARYQPEGRAAFEEKARRLLPAESFEHEVRFPLRRSDIDYNGHVHNTAYLAFALDVLSEEAARSAAIAKVHIAYKRPLRLGDAVIKLRRDGGVWNVCIFGGEGLCAIVELTEN